MDLYLTKSSFRTSCNIVILDVIRKEIHEKKCFLKMAFKKMGRTRGAEITSVVLRQGGEKVRGEECRPLVQKEKRHHQKKAKNGGLKKTQKVAFL